MRWWLLTAMCPGKNRTLSLSNNFISELPAGIFDPLTSLE